MAAGNVRFEDDQGGGTDTDRTHSKNTNVSGEKSLENLLFFL